MAGVKDIGKSRITSLVVLSSLFVKAVLIIMPGTEALPVTVYW